MRLQGMRSEDAEVFLRAAGWFGLYLLVRSTNPASLPYMSRKGYVAKRLDCKAKTADLNVVLNGREYETAGLVVDPNIVTHQAFTGGKHADAIKEWGKFSSKLATGIYDSAGRPTVGFYPGGGLYGVQMDPDHKHYGCVMFASNSLITAASYIHGDYDLYAIVDEKKRTETVFVYEAWLGEEHFRSPELLDVMTFVNSRIGRPMVLHGDQEKFLDHKKDVVYAFFPDGRTVKTLLGLKSIEHFYRTELRGRMTGGPNARTTQAIGAFEIVTDNPGSPPRIPGGLPH